VTTRTHYACITILLRWQNISLCALLISRPTYYISKNTQPNSSEHEAYLRLFRVSNLTFLHILYFNNATLLSYGTANAVCMIRCFGISFRSNPTILVSSSLRMGSKKYPETSYHSYNITSHHNSKEIHGFHCGEGFRSHAF
jgi:hypothetical protein